MKNKWQALCPWIYYSIDTLTHTEILALKCVAHEFIIPSIHWHIQKHWRWNVLHMHFFLRSEAGQKSEWSEDTRDVEKTLRSSQFFTEKEKFKLTGKQCTKCTENTRGKAGHKCPEQHAIWTEEWTPRLCQALASALSWCQVNLHSWHPYLKDVNTEGETE